MYSLFLSFFSFFDSGFVFRLWLFLLCPLINSVCVLNVSIILYYYAALSDIYIYIFLKSLYVGLPPRL
ncbi:hypothetical protein CPB84DRAFT_1773230, partial [Gymnopilus junonius]